jgi:hypothetical protein
MRVDIERLPPHVFLSHVHNALEPEPRAHRRRRYSVLAGPCFGDDPPLPHSTCEERLTDRVVDLVSARVIQIFALEIYGTPTVAESRGAELKGDGRPTYVESISSTSRRNDASAIALSNAAASSSRAGIKVSGT